MEEYESVEDNMNLSEVSKKIMLDLYNQINFVGKKIPITDYTELHSICTDLETSIEQLNDDNNRLANELDELRCKVYNNMPYNYPLVDRIKLAEAEIIRLIGMLEARGCSWMIEGIDNAKYQVEDNPYYDNEIWLNRVAPLPKEG